MKREINTDIFSNAKGLFPTRTPPPPPRPIKEKWNQTSKDSSGPSRVVSPVLSPSRPECNTRKGPSRLSNPLTTFPGYRAALQTQVNADIVLCSGRAGYNRKDMSSGTRSSWIWITKVWIEPNSLNFLILSLLTCIMDIIHKVFCHW